MTPVADNARNIPRERAKTWVPGLRGLRPVLAEPVVAAAIVNRLRHRATVINITIKGKSYRMRAYHDQQGGA